MNKLKISPNTFVLIGLILVASLSRLLTNWLHIYNFSPMAAMALFGGAYFRDKKMAFVVPLASMLFTDIFLGFYTGMFTTYAVFMLITCIGFWLRHRVSFFSVLAASLSASIVFFIITNFFVWIQYPNEYSNLIACYTAAIPFFGNTISGDLFFSGALFGSYEIVKRTYPSLAKATI